MLRDHKDDYQNNPAISEIGTISKHYTENVNDNIRKTTN